MKAALCLAGLCAIGALAAGCASGSYGIVSSDVVPRVDLTNGTAVCADDGINSIAASEIEWWLHSSPVAGLDERITAALEVSIRDSGPGMHSGTTTTCESHGVDIAFVRADGSVHASNHLTARFTVTASRDGSPHVIVDRTSLLSAANALMQLQDAELSSG